MENDSGLVHINKAKHELAQAKDIYTVLNIRDKAMAASVYLAAQGASEAANDAKEIQLRAERKAGEYLQSIPKAKGGQPYQSTNTNMVQVEDTLNDMGVTRNQSSRWQLTAELPEDNFEKYIAETKASGKELTSNAIQSAAKKLRGGRDLGPLMTSQTNEWYTTPDIIQLSIDVMGEIDLDPCSNDKINPNVPAKHHYTKEDDGLSRDWFGRIYMNPPYGTAIMSWVEKLVSEYENGQVEQAIALTPARPDTRWFRKFREYPRCFMFGRVKFNNHENSAPFPTMLVGLGVELDTFIDVMSKVGDIYMRINK